MTQPDTAVDVRFWAKVTKTDTCWPWNASLDQNGYGSFSVGGGLRVRAHRYSYELHHGAIAPGLHVDHTCHNGDLACRDADVCLHRRCVNPAHLEAVTPRENTLRGFSPAALNAVKTHCPQGHPYEAENMYQRPNGNRKCRVCKQDGDRLRAARLRRDETRGKLAPLPLAPEATPPRIRLLLELVAASTPRPEVAARLGVSESTVDHELERLCVTFGVANRAAIVDAAYRRGLIVLTPGAPAELDESMVAVLELVAEGRTNAEIGERLGIGMGKAKGLVERMLPALGAKDRVHAVALGWQRGLLGNSAIEAGRAAS